jgi:hypothetical protein
VTVTRFKIVSFVFGGVWQERATTSGETRLAVERITTIRATYYQQPLAQDEPVKRGVSFPEQTIHMQSCFACMRLPSLLSYSYEVKVSKNTYNHFHRPCEW